MTVYGFTASRNIAGVPKRAVVPYLMCLSDGTEFVTGGANGGDTFIGLWLYYQFNYATHTVIVPSNRSQVCEWWINCPSVNVIYMPDGTSYKDRNQAIVDRSNKLIGFPEYPEDDSRSLRSGTWQTIRLARKAGIPNEFHLLRG